MKYFFIILVLIITSCTSYEPVDFTLYGKVRNMEGSVFRIIRNGKVYDADTVKGGSFELHARVPALDLVMVDIRARIPDGNKTSGDRFWSGIAHFFVDSRSFYMIKAGGYGDFAEQRYEVLTTSTHQRQFDRLREWTNQRIHSQREKLKMFEGQKAYYLKNKDTLLYNAYSDSIKFVHMKSSPNRDAVNDFLFYNPNTYVAIYSMATSGTLRQDFDFYKSVYAKLSSKFRNHKYALRYKRRADQIEKMIKNNELK